MEELPNLGMESLAYASSTALPWLESQAWLLPFMTEATHLVRRHGSYAQYTLQSEIGVDSIRQCSFWVTPRLFLQGEPFEHAPRVLVGDALAAIQVPPKNRQAIAWFRSLFRCRPKAIRAVACNVRLMEVCSKPWRVLTAPQPI